MGRVLRHVLDRHLFLLIGNLTLGLFYLVALLDRAGMVGASGALAIPMRLLIIPIYLVWLLLAVAHVAILGTSGLPGPLAPVVAGIELVLGLAPYALADYLRNRWRRPAGLHDCRERDTAGNPGPL